MPSSTIVKSKTTFSFTSPKGVPVIIRENETFHRDSPRLAGLSDEAIANGFEAFTPDHDVEQATAAPGEKRRGGPKRGKKAAEKTEEKQATAAPGESDAGQSGESGPADAETVTPDPSQDDSSGKAGDSGDKS